MLFFSERQNYFEEKNTGFLYSCLRLAILSLELRNVHIHNLRSSEAPLLVVPKETGTFQHSAASIFNKLPSALRNIKDYNSFCRSLKKYLSNRVK